MLAVITGDIIDSRSIRADAWIDCLKSILADFGDSPGNWEVFRGDSFQLLLERPEDSLLVAMRIKAGLRSSRGQDARMAIGVGTVSYRAQSVTESNGDAFVRSGDEFDTLGKLKTTLSIRTPWQKFDEEFNLFLRLALIIMDDWTNASAEFVEAQLANRPITQTELSEILGVSQSSVSQRKRRAHYDELEALETRFRSKILEYL